MKVTSISLIAALFSPAAMAQPTEGEPPVPLRVAELVVDIRQNLNAGDHLRESRSGVATFMREAPSLTTFTIDDDFVSTLTDEEIVDYVASWIDFALTCRSATAARTSPGQYTGDDPPPDAPPVPGCNQPDIELDGWIGSRFDLSLFVEGTRTHAPSLEWAIQGLTASNYQEDEFYRTNSDTLSGWIGDPESIALVSFDTEEGRQLYDALDNYEDIYQFRLMSFWGYVGFADGQASLLMMMPVN